MTTRNKFDVLSKENQCISENNIDINENEKQTPIYLRERISNILIIPLKKECSENFLIVPMTRDNISETSNIQLKNIRLVSIIILIY